jgi:hypothetical protein
MSPGTSATLLGLLRERYPECACTLDEDRLSRWLVIRHKETVFKEDLSRSVEATLARSVGGGVMISVLSALYSRIEAKLFPNPPSPPLPRATKQTRRSLARRAAKERQKRAWRPSGP